MAFITEQELWAVTLYALGIALCYAVVWWAIRHPSARHDPETSVIMDVFPQLFYAAVVLLSLLWPVALVVLVSAIVHNWWENR